MKTTRAFSPDKDFISSIIKSIQLKYDSFFHQKHCQTINKKYRPSTGTEALEFKEKFCSQCKRECQPHPDWMVGHCQILVRSVIYETWNATYPRELVLDRKGSPTCKRFVKSRKQEAV